MSFDPADYHPDWKSIVRQINEQAENRCEFCGVPNGEYVVRERSDPDSWFVVSCFDGKPSVLESEWCTKIVLTTAHLCWETCADKRCIDPGHLRALCQRCHLNWDRPHHLAVQAENRVQRKIERGQLAFI